MSLPRSIYSYSCLPDSSTRLLRLLPHEDEHAPIECQLFNITLENTGRTRPYEALSYVWGFDYGSKSVLIDNCYLPITENLFIALSNLRDPSIERILWIDAICINQQDNAEKGHQVQSMAKIYSQATRVIVWLGKATPNINQVFDDIRIAGFTGKQTAELNANHDSILELLQAPWFRRIWVLQEIAAARHIVVQCGQAEIDGHAFFSGLSALKLPHRDYPGLKPLLLSVAYLAKGAPFRSRYTTSQGGRFSLGICQLAQLIDMYRNHEASDDRDKVYALLGMSSDDPSISGLSVNYDTSWATLFKQLVHYILGSVSVDTWDGRAVAVIRAKGYALGYVYDVETDVNREDKQKLRVVWNKIVEPEERHKWGRFLGFRSKQEYSPWVLQASTEPVEKDDVICLIHGARLPTIIRLHNDYWKIISIGADSPDCLQALVWDVDSELSRMLKICPHDFLLVWDWGVRSNKSSRQTEYKDVVGQLASKPQQSGWKSDCEKINRCWSSGVAMQSANYDRGSEILKTAIQDMEYVLCRTESLESVMPGCDNPKIRGNVEDLQRKVNLILKDKEQGTLLCLAAEVGCELITKLMLDMCKADPNAQDDRGEISLVSAARNGQVEIVKLLLSANNINPDARGQWQRTPLAVAAFYGHEAIVELLINTGKVDVNAAGGFPMTPLMTSAQKGDTAIVKILISTGEADPDYGYSQTSRYQTALTLAIENGHEAIVEMLLSVSQLPLDTTYYRYNNDKSTLFDLAGGHDGIIKLLQRAKEERKLK